MSRWKDEGIVYQRVGGWREEHSDEFLTISGNFGEVEIRLNYESKTIDFIRNDDHLRLKTIYLPLEEMEEIVGHMKGTIKRRVEAFYKGEK